jgi:hypothetical protein
MAFMGTALLRDRAAYYHEVLVYENELERDQVSGLGRFCFSHALSTLCVCLTILSSTCNLCKPDANSPCCKTAFSKPIVQTTHL